MVYCPPRTTILTGMSRAAALAALTQAQADYVALMSGNKGESFSYTQGDGTKSVTYTRANIAGLTQLIGMLQQIAGISRRSRRPVQFYF